MKPLWAVELRGGPQRVNHSAVVIGKHILMTGGYFSTYDSSRYHPGYGPGLRFVPIDVHDFNTFHLKWKKIDLLVTQDAPFMRYGHCTVSIDDTVYLFGGRNDKFGVCNALYSLKPAKRIWSKHSVTGAIPGPRDGHGMCVSNGNIYVFGGYVAEADAHSEELFMIDISTMTWHRIITKGQHGIWRDFHTFTAYCDKIYLFGGRSKMTTESDDEVAYDNDIKVLDLNTFVWSSAAACNQELPVGRRSHSAFVHKNCLYIFGGYNSFYGKHYNDLWKFELTSGLWSEVSTSGTSPCKRRRHCFCYIDNKAYIFGGTTPKSETAIADDDLLDLSDTHVLDLDPTLTSLCLHFVTKNRHLYDINCLPSNLRQTISWMSTNSIATEILPAPDQRS